MNVQKFFARLKKRIQPSKGLGSFLAERKLVILSVVLSIAVMSLIAATIIHTVNRLSPDDSETTPSEVVKGEPRHPLTGEIIDSAYETLPQVFAVMVENSADAWPLSGLDQAFLVIEAPVEGDIPRFVSFFSEESDVDEIGPVRSARPYYLDWNDAFDGVYTHVGGSPEALETIKTDYAEYDLNEFWQSEYFWRDNAYRYAPHNAYTNSDSLIESLDELDLPEPGYEPALFKDAEPVTDDETPVSLRLDWTSGLLYDVTWEYDYETNAYNRKQSGGYVAMRDGARIVANNVIVMETDIRTVDDVGRKHIRTLGEGNAAVFQDGRAIDATWKKETTDASLKFYTKDGNEIALNPGKTWIEVVEDLDAIERF